MAVVAAGTDLNQYVVHGIPISVRADDEWLRGAAADLLWPFAMPAAARTPSGMSRVARSPIRVRMFSSAAPDTRPATLSRWMEYEEVCGLTDGLVAYLDYGGQYVARLVPEDDTLEAWIPHDLPGTSYDQWIVGHRILAPLLIDALRTRGLFMLHAAALARHGRVVIFPAESGAGKTTLSLALLRGGFQLLSDDCPLLGRTGDRVVVRAFPDRVNVTEQTCAFFPELRPIWQAGPFDVRRHKTPIDVTTAYGDCVAQRGAPAAIVFPARDGAERTTVEPLARREALLRLLSFMGPSALPNLRHTQFALLADLVRVVACFQMHTGRDFEELPRIVEQLLVGGRRLAQNGGHA